MAAYYALSYDERRVQLTLHELPGSQVDGFAAVCQTGYDLFVPLVILRASTGGVPELLCGALQPGRPYRIVAPLSLGARIGRTMSLDRQQVNNVYRLDPAAYRAANDRSAINVMVQRGQVRYRFEVRSQGEVASAAGVNWRSEHWAELYVYTEPAYRGRGWARVVGAACVRALLEDGLLPLYIAAQDNLASQRLAAALGFEDSGAREFECNGSLRSG
jgi:RimJ/RimL family protein N-acetyltransferase